MDDVVLSFATDARRSHEEATYVSASSVGALSGKAAEAPKRGARGQQCLHCGRSVHKKQVFPCVMTFDRYTGNMKFGPGIFDSPECALGFLTDTKASADSLSFTRWMFLEMYGFPHHRVKSALPRWSLKQFGGPLDLTKARDAAAFFRRSEEDGKDVECFDSVSGIPYAMVLEVKLGRENRSKTADEALALSGKTSGLRRPEQRKSSSVSRAEQTGEPPILLNKFAKMLAAETDKKTVVPSTILEEQPSAPPPSKRQRAEEKEEDQAPQEQEAKAAKAAKASRASVRARPRRRKR